MGSTEAKYKDILYSKVGKNKQRCEYARDKNTLGQAVRNEREDRIVKGTLYGNDNTSP